MEDNKTMVRKLLQRMTKWAYNLLKKAESSDIDFESVELCCITLTLIKHSPLTFAIYEVI